MRIGFIGTGAMAHSHAMALRRIGVQIAACWGTNAQKNRRFAADYGAEIHDDPMAMIRRGVIDALFIVVPPFAHDGRVELAAVAQGIPFLVEKPVGMNLEVCRDVAAAVESRGLVTAVGYQMRQSPLGDEIRQVTARNRISSARCSRIAGVAGTAWWRKMALSGGPMVEQTTHLVDFLRYVIKSPVTRVAAFVSSGIAMSRYEGADIYDSMEAIVTFADGVIGSIGLATTFANGFRKSEPLEVYGQDFYLSLGGGGLRYQEGKADFVERPQPAEVDAMERQARGFLEAVRNNDPSAVRCSYDDGVRTLAVTLAMNESAQTNAVVTLNEG